MMLSFTFIPVMSLVIGNTTVTDCCSSLTDAICQITGARLDPGCFVSMGSVISFIDFNISFDKLRIDGW